MRSARSLFWLQLALGTLGAAAAALAATAALRSVNPALPSWTDLRAACSTMLSGGTVGRMLIVALASIGLAVPVRAARSIIRQAWGARRLLRSLAAVGTQDGSPPVITVAEERPLAFCAGLLHPRIYVSTGARQLLGHRELCAVIAHERHHARRRDPLRGLIVEAVRDAVFFVPVLAGCRARYGSLAELAADEHAIAAAGVRPLAGALATFDAHGGPLVAVSAERVDHLLGARSEWQLRPTVLIASLSSIASVAALAGATFTVVGREHVTLVGLASTGCGVASLALVAIAARLVVKLFGQPGPSGRQASGWTIQRCDRRP